MFILDLTRPNYGAVLAGPEESARSVPRRWTPTRGAGTRLFLCLLFRRRHGSGHRQRLDPAEAAGEGAARAPPDRPPAAEEPREEAGLVQREPGRHLLQSPNFRLEEEEAKEARCARARARGWGVSHAQACAPIY